MNRLQRAALLTELADRLLQGGGWCGETQLQKATYFLEELLKVPLGFTYIMYKHGPFSFDLRDELTAMRADGLLGLRRMPPYSPSLVPTEQSKQLRQLFPRTLEGHKDRISFVADHLADKGVVDLEQLATALYVTLEAQPSASLDARAQRINKLKPHVSVEEAREAVKEVDAIIDGAQELRPC